MKFLILFVFVAIVGFFVNFEGNNNYIVKQVISNVEIREYSKQLYASYLPENINDRNNSFRNVAGFIFGGNKQNEKIAMTSPVVIKLHNKNEMAFIMPNEYTLQNIPQPNSNKIKIYEEPSKIRAAIRYSGYSSSKKEQNKIEELKKILNKNNIVFENDFEVLVYNSPWKFLNRRNEIIVSVNNDETKIMKTNKNNLNTIYFGGGCFWCVEAVFEDVIGVINVKSGYAGGKIKNPSYREVSKGLTNHAEVCELTYDPNVIGLKDLLKIFFLSHDPTTINRQGNDIGPHYRSIILYENTNEKNIIAEFKENINKEIFDNQIVTEVKKLDAFYHAESYHQNYYKNNLSEGYCRAVISPKVLKAKKELNVYYK